MNFYRSAMKTLMMRLAFLVVLTLLCVASTTLADITAEIMTVGFPGDGDSKYVYRGGCFAPLAVRLSLSNEEARQVFVRIEQHDRDGDIVFTEKPIGLMPDMKGPGRMHWLYFVPNPNVLSSDRRLTIQILDENRETLKVIHGGVEVRKVSLAETPEMLSESEFVVLSVTEGTAGKIRSLSDFRDEDGSEFMKPLRVAHVPPDLLPDHWHGLEMVDAIVWDAADPSRLSLSQQQAVLQWVEHGGRLFLAAGGSADALAKSEFAEHLPVKISGIGVRQELPSALAEGAWGRDEQGSLDYSKPIQVAKCDVRDGSQALVQSAAKTQTFLARRRVGRGSITFMSLTVSDLFQVDGQVRDFFRKVLELRRADNIDVQQGMFAGHPIDLFGRMHEFINFQESMASYVLIAMLFVVVYGLVATWGCWYVLKARGLLKHSWSVFFIVAAVASLISVAAVQAIQGVGRELHQLTIVDSTVDTYSAAAHGYFGLKTSSYVQDIDLWLPQGPPGDGNPPRSPHYLRPLSPANQLPGSTSHFADTKRYQTEPSRAVLRDVPIRATLKQFEGFWMGSMDGQLSASVQLPAQRQAGDLPFLPGSTITNKLGRDLVDCYLIEARLNPGSVAGSRSSQIFVHPLGIIRDGEELDVAQRLDMVSGLDKDYPKEHTLQKYHEAWVKSISSISLIRGSFRQDPKQNIESWQKAIMLLTTFSEYLPEVDTSMRGYMGYSTELLQTNSRWLDRSAELNRDVLMLVGFAAEPGPARLYGRRGESKFRYVLPKKSVTVYRFVIPIRRGA